MPDMVAFLLVWNRALDYGRAGPTPGPIQPVKEGP
jgi:hypothetical protein